MKKNSYRLVTLKEYELTKKNSRIMRIKSQQINPRNIKLFSKGNLNRFLMNYKRSLYSRISFYDAYIAKHWYLQRRFQKIKDWNVRVHLLRKKLFKSNSWSKKLPFWNEAPILKVFDRLYFSDDNKHYIKRRSLRKSLKFKKDFFKREVLAKDMLELRFTIFKYLIVNENVAELKYFFLYLFQRWLKWSWSFSKYNNRCLVTFRHKGVFRLVRVSRVCVKLMVNNDYLTGVRRSVW